ncbi:MAG TPA: metallophosphoesterase [Ktedonobacterales bacterium]|nr:metallophosphoesterase [Ktedonobacterales bacterium]
MSERVTDADAPMPEQPELTMTVPALSLVVIASRDASAARTLAATQFSPEEVVTVEPESVSLDAFEAARVRITRRLADGFLCVALIHSDDTALTAALARVAHYQNVAPVALVLGRDIPLARFPIGQHSYAAAHMLATPEEWEAARIVREPLACDLRGERGPFDIIGDVHGCYDELCQLFTKLGYMDDGDDGMRHPEGRRAVFVGDLVDRGPGVVQVARLVMRMVAAGEAFCAPGNHDIKLMRALEGRHVRVAHGLQETLDQIASLPTEAARESFARDFIAFVRQIPPYLVLDGGALVVAHAGLPERYHGRISERVRSLVFYGETTGWEDEYGHPERIDWAADYRGAAAVVYGHTPHRTTLWRNNTINVDTGCVHGGRLAAARWPERDIVSVAARREYAHRAGGLR